MRVLSVDQGDPMPDLAIDFDQLARVKPGDTLKLRFQENAIPDLIYIDAMDSSGCIELKPGDRALIAAVRSSGSWEHSSNRDLSVIVGLRWDRQFFEGRTRRRVLESLEVIPS